MVATGTGDNPIDMVNGSTLRFGGTGAGAFLVYDQGNTSPTVTLSGDLSAGQTLTVDGESNCGVGTTTVAATGSFTNGGTISTADKAPGYGYCPQNHGNVVFTLPAGDTLTNSGTLSLLYNGQKSSVTEGVSQTVSGNLTNTGTINVGESGWPSSNVVLNGGTVVNEGAVNVDPGSIVTTSSATGVTNAVGGLITNQGGVTVQGTFEQDAGAVAQSQAITFTSSAPSNSKNPFRWKTPRCLLRSNFLAI